MTSPMDYYRMLDNGEITTDEFKKMTLRPSHSGNYSVNTSEKDLQRQFLESLGKCRQYVRTAYGIIDIVSDEYIYECKSVLNLKNAQCAIGQLYLYKNAFPDRKMAIVHGRLDVSHRIVTAIQSLGIEIIEVNPKKE